MTAAETAKATIVVVEHGSGLWDDDGEGDGDGNGDDAKLEQSSHN